MDTKIKYLGLELKSPVIVGSCGLTADVDKMVEMGLENEVVSLLKKYGEDAPAFRAIGVKEFIPYVEGKQDIETVIENIKLDTRHYVKRQDTFFRHQFPAIEVSSLEDILKVIENERDN